MNRSSIWVGFQRSLNGGVPLTAVNLRCPISILGRRGGNSMWTRALVFLAALVVSFLFVPLDNSVLDDDGPTIPDMEERCFVVPSEVRLRGSPLTPTPLCTQAYQRDLIPGKVTVPVSSMTCVLLC